MAAVGNRSESHRDPWVNYAVVVLGVGTMRAKRSLWTGERAVEGLEVRHVITGVLHLSITLTLFSSYVPSARILFLPDQHS